MTDHGKVLAQERRCQTSNLIPCRKLRLVVFYECFLHVLFPSRIEPVTESFHTSENSFLACNVRVMKLANEFTARVAGSIFGTLFAHTNTQC
jgi:hypothetical protein